jgi:hypothetical protein
MMYAQLRQELTKDEMLHVLGFMIQAYPDDARIMLRQHQLESIDKK